VDDIVVKKYTCATQPGTATPTRTATRTPTRTPTTTPGGAIEVTAWVSNATPAKYTNVTVYGKITQGGVGISGVPMHTTWHYKTTTSYCDGTSGSNGVASCTRGIGNATAGYTVWIDVDFTYQGHHYYARTSFTPHSVMRDIGVIRDVSEAFDID
jgi:hypothetical protein